MENPPAGIPSPCVDHLADLVVAKTVGNTSSTFSPVARLTQQETLQGFVQGVESILRSQPGDLAELLKGEVVAEDRPGRQEIAGGGRKPGKATLDHLAYIRGKWAARWSGLEDRELRLKCPATSRDQAGNQDAAFKQFLKQGPQIERLSIGFRE